ncbi:MAG: radical SAM protein, partial [Deltaproteobacteria bacterium]
EVTVECNPESATPDLLDLLRERGVNRISLGIQAFDAADLRRLGRVSTPAECRRAIGEVAARFPTWSADLILGIPGSGRQRLESALEELVGAGVPHLSFYCLEAPPARARRVGDRMDEASESLKADLYRFTAHWVEMHGFDHYEISNAARPGHWARHNRAYWQGETYVGLGPGAHSLEGGVRIANLPRLDAYLAALEGGDLPPQRREARTPERIREEAILLGVRTSEGIPLDLTRGKEDFLRALTRRALAGIEGERLRLTPEGWLFADEIAVRLIG